MAGVGRHRQQIMELDGSDADGEWSDASEDLLKSGSATAASDSEGEDTPRIIIKAPRKAANRNIDVTDSLMDKIDKELHILNTSPTPPFSDKEKRYLPNPNRTDVTIQRVEWNKKEVNGTHQSKADVSHHSSEREGTDTGLGTCSIHDESPSDLDKVKMYPTMKRGRQTEVRAVLEDNSEEDAIMKYGGHSDLDSVAAQQIDEKFQEIMRRKKGGYLDDLKARMQSDAETIMTEDFQDKFQDALIYQSSDSETIELKGPESEGTMTPRSDDVRRQTANTAQKAPGERSSPKHSRTSSVPIQRPVKPTLTERSRTPPSSKQPSTFSLPSFHKISTKQPTGPVQPQRRGYISDVDSIQTEDYEAKFHGLLVKQVAGVPVTSFRTGAVDSDLDSVSGQMIHKKVQKVLKSSPYWKEAEASESDPDGPQRLRPPTRRRGRGPSSYRKQAVLNGAGPHGKALKSGPNYRVSQKDRQIGEDTETEIAKNAAEIAQESARIQKEMEQERRSKSPPAKSPPRSPSRYEGNRSPSRFDKTQTPPRKLPLKAFRIKPADDTEDNELPEDPGLPPGWNERRVITQETLRQQTQLRSTEADLREMEQILKENRAKAEDARTQLMLTEFRRSNSNKELEKLSDELNLKRKQMKALEVEAATKRAELEQLDSLGLTKEEVVTMVEENTTLNHQIKNRDALQLERDELLRQLEATKTDLFSEQKTSRKKLEEYQEEVESLNPKLEEAQTECEQLAQKLHQLQNESRGVEKDRDDALQERDKLIDELRDTIQRDHLEARKHYSKDTEELRQKIHVLNCRVLTMEADNSEQEDIVMALRDEIIDLQQQVGREQSLRDTLKEEHSVILTHIKLEHENALASLRGSLTSEKDAEMDKLQSDLDREKTEDASKLQEQLNEQLTEQSRQISMKSQEISRLQDQIQVFEENRLQVEDRVRVETQKQVREAVEKERQIQQTEHEWLLQREKEMAVSDLKKQLTDLNVQLGHERKTKESAQNHMINLQKEIDNLHSQTKEAGKSKVMAVARAKELAREQGHTELQRLKEKFKQEYKKEIDRLRQVNRSQDDDIKQLKSDIETKAKRDRENGLVLDRTERTIVNELNEECRRTANLLDVTPRKINVNSFKLENSGKGPGRTPSTAALANLRACNEQLRNHVSEVVQERDGLKNTSDRLLQEKDHFAELENIGSRSSVDDNWMAALKEKDKELRDIQKSLNSWKEDTAEKFAKKFEDELNKELEKQQKKQKDIVRLNDSQQKQIERLEREVHKLTMNQKISPASADSLASNKMVHNLQMKMKQLQSENNSLRRSKYSSSVPDLTVGSLYHQKDLNPIVEKDDFSYLSYRYQTKPERDVDPVIERPQSPISKRLTEMNKLQTTLSNQTKELKQLERAYSQLHAPRSPSRNSLQV